MRYLSRESDSYLIASSVVIVMAQRLVRQLCSSCKREKNPSAEEMSVLRLTLSIPIFTPQGCPECRGTGYRGRGAIAEILIFDEALSELLTMSPSRGILKEAALKKGYAPMAIDAQMRVLRGETSLAEVLRVVDLREGV